MEKPKTCLYRPKKIYKTLNNSEYQNKLQKVYMSMGCMPPNVENLEEITETAQNWPVTF